MTSQQQADELLATYQQHRGTKMRNVSDILAAIQSKGDWLQRDAKALSDFVALLPFRRDFPTMAEDAMDLAERELLEALKSVRASRKNFNAKPVERSRAA